MPRAHDDDHEDHHGPRGRGGFGGRGCGGRGHPGTPSVPAAPGSPSPGTVYPSLQLLADEGLIASTDQNGRNVFALTADGATRAAEAAGAAPPWERLAATAGSVDLRQVGRRRRGNQATAATGTADQVVKADAIVTEARKRLYLLLAG